MKPATYACRGEQTVVTSLVSGHHLTTCCCDRSSVSICFISVSVKCFPRDHRWLSTDESNSDGSLEATFAKKEEIIRYFSIALRSESVFFTGRH